MLTLLKQPAPHELTPGEIAAAIGVTSGGMTKALNKLVERELVLRTVSQTDRRSRRVRLTAKGTALVEATLQTIIVRHGTIMADILGAAERQQLTGLLEKLLEHQEKEGEQHPALRIMAGKQRIDKMLLGIGGQQAEDRSERRRGQDQQPP